MRTGSIELKTGKMRDVNLSLKERFDSNYIKNNESGCWIWSSSLNHDGYGRIFFKGTRKMAHVVAFEIYREEVPAGMKVCHTCDVRCCVNPSHLFLGTQLDNVRDMITKGRANIPKGSMKKNSKIDEKTAILIKRGLVAGVTPTKLAITLSVSRHIVFSIKNGKSWRHAA
jgi:hypothetical protein